MIELKCYLLISVILFICGIVIMLSRKNIIAILLGVEFMLNASALNFVAYSKYMAKNIDGQVFTLFLIVVAAAEAAVGLAIAIRFFQLQESIHIDDATQLQS
jgi:NADH:ubiquinone oxidoreductase subunit K